MNYQCCRMQWYDQAAQPKIQRFSNMSHEQQKGFVLKAQTVHQRAAGDPRCFFRAIGPQLRAGLRGGDRAVGSTRELRWILRGLGPASEAADVAEENREWASAHRLGPRPAFSPRSLRRRWINSEQGETSANRTFSIQLGFIFVHVIWDKFKPFCHFYK